LKQRPDSVGIGWEYVPTGSIDVPALHGIGCSIQRVPDFLFIFLFPFGEAPLVAEIEISSGIYNLLSIEKARADANQEQQDGGDSDEPDGLPFFRGAPSRTAVFAEGCTV